MCAEERDRRVSERWHPASAPLAAVLHAPLPLDVEHDPQIPCRDTTSHRQLRTPAHTCPSNPLALPSCASLPRPPRPPRLAATRPADACPAPACAACPHLSGMSRKGGPARSGGPPFLVQHRRDRGFRASAGRVACFAQGATPLSATPRGDHLERTRAARPAKQGYAAGDAIAGASAAALTSMRSGIVIVILPSRSSSQRALTIVTPITSLPAL
jgi:hypothetical protein